MKLARAAPWLLATLVPAVTWRELGEGLVQAAKNLSGHVFPETFFLVSRWSVGSVPLWLPNEHLGQLFLALLYTQALIRRES